MLHVVDACSRMWSWCSGMRAAGVHVGWQRCMGLVVLRGMLMCVCVYRVEYQSGKRGVRVWAISYVVTEVGTYVGGCLVPRGYMLIWVLSWFVPQLPMSF